MENFILATGETLFSQYSSHLGYLGIFLFFITIDQVTPLPEEVTLLTIGYLSSQHVFNPLIAGIVSLAAFLAVDSAYYFLARSGNKFARRIVEGKKSSFISKYKEKFKKHFAPTLLVLCFIPRMRMFGPVFAGIMNLSFKKFLLFDSIGLAAFTALYISLGLVFQAGFHAQMEKLGHYRHFIFAGAMIILATLIILFIKRRNQTAD
jgi:membrane-associated protein